VGLAGLLATVVLTLALAAKGYVRKANVKFAMKDYTQALEACQEARAVDKDGKSNAEISVQERKCMEAQFTAESTETDEERLQRASRDPETAALMNDPILMSILQQAQSDPKVLQAHMANEDFRRKIAKVSLRVAVRRLFLIRHGSSKRRASFDWDPSKRQARARQDGLQVALQLPSKSSSILSKITVHVK
jgi:tetratricopeptide (TPR) repeat protein